MEEVRKKVLEIVSNQQSEIIWASFKQMVKHHRPDYFGCDCSYCSTQNEYVSLKLIVHRFRQNFDQGGYYQGHKRHSLEYITELSDRIDKLKQFRKEMKQI